MSEPEDNRIYREPAPQLPPADELAAIRNQVKALKERDAFLREMMLRDPTSRTGNNFCAEIITITQSRVDIKEMRAMHSDIVEEYTFPLQHETVVLKAITPDGEIIARPRKAKP